MNIVLFNLPESEHDSGEERKEEDTQCFLQICLALGITEVEIKLMFRLGNKKQGVIRPLKVILENRKTRKEILDNAKHISTKVQGKYKKVVIVKDLTQKQRDFNRKRREEGRRLRGTEQRRQARNSSENQNQSDQESMHMDAETTTVNNSNAGFSAYNQDTIIEITDNIPSRRENEGRREGEDPGPSD